MTVRRLKTYTAQTGYVYQYYFVGKRPPIEPGVSASEYIFDVTSDRSQTIFAVSVLVRQDALRSWADQHGRPLSDTEQYATAKLRLQQGFDEVLDMMGSGRLLEVTPGNIEEILSPLDLG